MSSLLNSIENAQLPQTIEEADADRRTVKSALRVSGVPHRIINGIETRALRSGRRQTGLFQSNRNPRWTLQQADPQYGTELNCKIIEMRLMGMLLQFTGAPEIAGNVSELLHRKYLGSPIQAGIYRDSLLLEEMEYAEFVAETLQPTHGVSNFHIGHEDPKITPKHTPENVAWRSHRSNLIQGDMTLRQARIYIIKLIGRYFELGELNVN
jgi:hypothetical protein